MPPEGRPKVPESRAIVARSHLFQACELLAFRPMSVARRCFAAWRGLVAKRAELEHRGARRPWLEAARPRLAARDRSEIAISAVARLACRLAQGRPTHGPES